MAPAAGIVEDDSSERATASRVGQASDARGRRVSVLDPYSLRLARRHDIIPAEPLEDIAREIGFGLPRSQQVLFIVSVVCLGIALLGVAERCTALL